MLKVQSISEKSAKMPGATFLTQPACVRDSIHCIPVYKPTLKTYSTKCLRFLRERCIAKFGYYYFIYYATNAAHKIHTTTTTTVISAQSFAKHLKKFTIDKSLVLL